MPLLPQKANQGENAQGMDDRSPIPPGEYPAMIAKTELKQTKKKDGHYLAITFRVIDGEYKGRAFWTNLNLDNPSAVAVEIANKELNSICQACNKQGVEDSDELLQIPMIVTVKIEPGNDQWPASNTPTGYAMFSDAVQAEVPADAPAPAHTAPPVAEKPTKMPWES